MGETAAKYTVLITGASLGIGKELAGICAREGRDVVLVARGEAKLRELASELERAYHVRAHVVPADLADPGAPKAIVAAVENLGVEVTHLVNNAGFGSNGAFIDADLEREKQMVQVNCVALLELCHLFGAKMRQKGFGRIVNVASTAAFLAGPYMSTYYATKAFVVSFSEGIAYELAGTGVTVTAYCPGATATEFAAQAKMESATLFKSGALATAGDVAHDCYRAMEAGPPLAIHGMMNTMSAVAVRLSPRRVMTAIAARLNRPS